VEVDLELKTTDRFEQARGEEAQAADETLTAQMVGAYN